MVKLLKDKFGIEVSESTIRRALQEHEYHYKIACTWSCKISYSRRSSIFNLSKTRSNLISKTWKFLPVPENFLVY